MLGKILYQILRRRRRKKNFLVFSDSMCSRALVLSYNVLSCCFCHFLFARVMKKYCVCGHEMNLCNICAILLLFLPFPPIALLLSRNFCFDFFFRSFTSFILRKRLNVGGARFFFFTQSVSVWMGFLFHFSLLFAVYVYFFLHS